MKTCLILVDIQNDYFPGGNMSLVGIEEAASQARRLLQQFRSAGHPVIHIQHFSQRAGSGFLVPGTEGVEIHPTVAPQAGEPVIAKNYPNSFRDTLLLVTLRELGVERLVIAGAMSHMCIDATTRAAFDLGFSCVVAEDACATRDLVFKGETVPAAQVHASFMTALAAVYAKVVGTEEALQS